MLQGEKYGGIEKSDKFCLPYETRKLVELENIEDECLKAQVLAEFETCAQELSDDVCPRTMANVTNRVVELTFEEQGLELAAFLEADAGDYEQLSVSDQVDVALQECGLSLARRHS